MAPVVTDDEPLMISFSGGRTSAFMTNELLKEYPNAIVCFCNTGKENNATLDFVHKCDQMWGGNRVVWLEYNPFKEAALVPAEHVAFVPSNAKVRRQANWSQFDIVTYETAHRTDDKSKLSPFQKLIIKRKFVPNIRARFCTQELKVRVIKHFMISMGYKHWINVIGIRYDEPARWAKTKGVALKERWETWLPLVDWKTVKKDVLDFWKTQDFDLELEEWEGNCDLCFLKGKAKKIRILRSKPEIADWWVEMEQDGWFRRDYSVKHLLQAAAAMNAAPQGELFEEEILEDEDIACFCTTD